MATIESASKSKLVHITIILLLVFTVLMISYRFIFKNEDGVPTGDSAWTITINHKIKVLEKGASVHISPPWNTIQTKLYAQSMTHPGFRQKRIQTGKKERDIVLVASQPGNFNIETAFSIYVSKFQLRKPVNTQLTEHDRAAWLAESRGVKINTALTSKIVDRTGYTESEPDEMIEKLFDFVSSRVRINPRASNDSEIALKRRRASTLGSNRALLALLRTARLPARLVTGVYLQDSSALQPFFWTEVYLARNWVPLDPVNGYFKKLPAYYIPFVKGSDQIIYAVDAKIQSTVFGIDYIPELPSVLSTDKKQITDILDLNRLSPAIRENLGMLLLLPLGALATEIMRQLGGVRTYGTFTPTLLAMSTVQVDWTTAGILFLLVMLIAITIRSFVPFLILQRTARLALVFTLVSMSMVIVLSGLIYLDPTTDSTVVLLPVVVLTMMVDRIYSIADIDGTRVALVRLFWTLVAAMISVLILLQVDWGLWLVTYPEVHAMTLALIILLGLFAGPRLSEFNAFKWMREPQSNRKKRRKNNIAA